MHISARIPKVNPFLLLLLFLQSHIIFWSRIHYITRIKYSHEPRARTHSPTKPLHQLQSKQISCRYYLLLCVCCLSYLLLENVCFYRQFAHVFLLFYQYIRVLLNLRLCVCVCCLSYLLLENMCFYRQFAHVLYCFIKIRVLLNCLCVKTNQRTQYRAPDFVQLTHVHVCN